MLQAPVTDRKNKPESTNSVKFAEHEQQNQAVNWSGRLPHTRDRSDLATIQQAYGNQAALRRLRTEKGRSPVANPLQVGVLQRKCACGNSAGSTGSCAECRSKKEEILQTKLQIGEAGDRYKQDADRVADLVMWIPEPTAKHQIESEEQTKISGRIGGWLQRAPLDDDPIHQPIIDQFREDQGFPNDSVDEFGQQVGLSDAEIKYRYAQTTCSVASGPTYSPTGIISVRDSIGPLGSKTKSAIFTMAATFNTNIGQAAKCCEVHQFVKWDQAYAAWNNGPPSSGFPSSAPPDTWIEDRDQDGKRYGHRTDSFSSPQSACVDEYKTGAKRDQANGNQYCGSDEPRELAMRRSNPVVGQWQFRLDVVDTCNGNVTKASSPVITINWG